MNIDRAELRATILALRDVRAMVQGLWMADRDAQEAANPDVLPSVMHWEVLTRNIDGVESDLTHMVWRDLVDEWLGAK